MPARWKLASSPLEPRFQPRRSSFENECYQHNSTEKAERRFAGVATNRDRWKREIGFQRASPSSFPRTDLSRSSTYRNTFFYAARPNFSLHLFYPRFIPPGFRFSLITPFIRCFVDSIHPIVGHVWKSLGYRVISSSSRGVKNVWWRVKSVLKNSTEKDTRVG